jgi:hypothetical protein
VARGSGSGWGGGESQTQAITCLLCTLIRVRAPHYSYAPLCAKARRRLSNNALRSRASIPHFYIRGQQLITIPEIVRERFCPGVPALHILQMGLQDFSSGPPTGTPNYRWLPCPRHPWTATRVCSAWKIAVFASRGATSTPPSSSTSPTPDPITTRRPTILAPFRAPHPSFLPRRRLSTADPPIPHAQLIIICYFRYTIHRICILRT